MKRIVLAVILLAAAYTISAQEVTTTTTTTVNNTDQVPLSIRTNFQQSYPMATDVTWTAMNDWWYATYRDENKRIVKVYYNTQPYYLERNENYMLSLPVLNTFVPDDVITSAINTYGNSLYSITMSKAGENGMQPYHVTVIKNGVSEIVMMNAEAVAANKMKPL